MLRTLFRHRVARKLITSYVLLVLLCLLLSGVAAGVLVTRAQRKVNLRLTQAIAVGVAQRLWAASSEVLTQPGLRAHLPDLVERLRGEGPRLSGRLLILDSEGEVIADSVGTGVGERVPLPRRWPLSPGIPPNVRRHTLADGRDYFLVYADLPITECGAAPQEWGQCPVLGPGARDT